MIILLHAHPQVPYSNRVKFHQYLFIRQGGVVLTKHLDRLTEEQIKDRLGDLYLQNNKENNGSESAE